MRLAFIGGLVGVTFASLPAAAQTVQQGERVEVTGSNIRRLQTETASPVQTLSREEIARSGRSSVAELLQTLTIDNAGSVPKTFGNGFSTGGSGASLRGLGANATLVLLNGRRVAPYGLADDGTKSYTDLNLIPIEAVDRIEILKDGGSAIYGSDAIAGVINVILRKEFNGLIIKGTVGQSLEYGDGRDVRTSITGGIGNLDTDRFNVFGNIDYNKRDAVQYSNRTDRGYLGRTNLVDDGFQNGDTFFGPIGNGFIGLPGTALTRNTVSSSIIGNVRNLAGPNAYYSRDDLSAGTGFTRTFPGAACANFGGTTRAPGGGCVTDNTNKYSQILPSAEEYNFYGKATFRITPDIDVYMEGNYFDGRSRTQTTPTAVNDAGRASPNGAFLVTNADMAANHPDNPYFGSRARLRYLASDLGPRTSATDSRFSRFLIGSRGTVAGWDFDTAVVYSRDRLTNARKGYIQADVLQALLEPNALIAGSTTITNAQRARANSGAYAALPAGTFYRIGENAGLNSAATYAALSPTIYAYGKSDTALGDIKVSRELFNLPGGPLGIAFGGEFRHESNSLTPTTGTDRANVIGLGYSAYDLSRNVSAAFAEIVAPVVKQVELSLAGRYDHYSDAGNSFTPKAGIKITPIQQLAIRGTFSKGFRAPSAAEAGGGTAAFSTSADPVRCASATAAGVPAAQAATFGCASGQVAIVSAGNPNLEPEKSKTFTGGIVFEPTNSTSIALDYFKITRKNEIKAGVGANEDYVRAGNVTRDTTNTQFAGDPGALVAILQPYQNASKTIVRGLDLDAKQDLALGSFGKLTFGANWTHFFQYAVLDGNGNLIEYAGTHGDCNVSNCMGTMKDRVQGSVTYGYGGVTVSTVVNYRPAFKNIETATDTACEHTSGASGGANPIPDGCRIGSFTTFDLTARWQVTRNWQVNGVVQNVFDRKAPFDPTTYGAVHYNPLDYSGAIGRFFYAGARYSF